MADKEYAVVIGQAVLKLTGSSPVAIATKIEVAMKNQQVLTSPMIDPEELKVLSDALVVISPGPGMLYHIKQWDAYVKKYKQRRAQRQLTPQGVPPGGIPVIFGGR